MSTVNTIRGPIDAMLCRSVRATFEAVAEMKK